MVIVVVVVVIVHYYLRRRLGSREIIVSLGVTQCVCVCVRRAATARRISLGGEGNALYPVLSSFHAAAAGLMTLLNAVTQTDQSGLPTMSVAEKLLWSIDLLSVVYAEQLEVFRAPLNLTTRNLGKTRHVLALAARNR